MTKNNIEVDVKAKCIGNGLTQMQLAETIGTIGAVCESYYKEQEGIVNKTCLQMLRAFRCDIELN